MSDSPVSARRRFDRIGIILSGLCAAHCVIGLALVAALGVGGGILLHPASPRVGLVLAAVSAAVAIGWGALRNRRPLPFAMAMTGIRFMGGALAVEHGMEEALLTVIGVTLVACGHFLNLRRAA